MDFSDRIPPGVGSLVGKSVGRTEDREMLRGEATFLEDIRLPDETHAVFVRSIHPHAELHGINTVEALGVPGVVAVLTGADLAADILGEEQTRRMHVITTACPTCGYDPGARLEREETSGDTD